jgi:hypothetical protein
MKMAASLSYGLSKLSVFCLLVGLFTVALWRFYEKFDFIAIWLEAESEPMISDVIRDIMIECTHVSVPCEWQQVYCDSIFSVSVGPRIWYSDVPAMQYLL